MIITTALIAAFSALLAGGIAWFVRGIQSEKYLAAAVARLERVPALEKELDGIRILNSALHAENAAVNAKMERDLAAHEQQVEQLTAMRGELQNQFKLLAGEVLNSSSEEFKKKAVELFEQHKETAKRDISDLVKPLETSLRAYEVALDEIEKARITGYTELGTTLKTLTGQNDEVRQVTANLVNALKASPKTRGRWGEETLKRVMEMSDMVEHCDFDMERHFPGAEESLRPDVVISVAGGRTIIVDAKAPIKAYLDATTADSEEQKELLLSQHAKQLRERLANLSSKSYAQKISGSADCVVMFVPGDNFVSAAFERDPNLFEDGINSRVLICTPTTFIALAKAISYGWRQERLAKNALDVSRLGKELYHRLKTLGEHVSALGKNINGAAQKYNLLIGSLENSVLPQARRFNELGVEGATEELAELVQVDTVARMPEKGRDLLTSDGGDAAEP